MSRTLLILGTHFIDEAVVSEYKKMRDTPNVDVIMAIDNNAYKYEFRNRIESKIFFGVSVRCFFFDAKLHEEMELPYFTFYGVKDLGGVMWSNGDYRFYYLRKYFPDYEYYWMIEYDVFCNAKNYGGFLQKFADDRSDLVIADFRHEQKNGSWHWTHGTEWVYGDWEVYGSFFPVVRLSARAADYLYERRLAHKEIFREDGKSRWIFCEVFVPTELMHAGYSCGNLNESEVKYKPNRYLNDERLFVTPDDHLYHPVKSARGEISKLQEQVAGLNLSLRKLFLTTLIRAVDMKSLPVQFEQQFNFAILKIALGGGRYSQFLLLGTNTRQCDLHRSALRRQICGCRRCRV